MTTNGVKILEVRGIKARALTTHSVILTFMGSVLPGKVYLEYLALNVQLYVPWPFRCFKCPRFGHVRDKCRVEVRYPTCGGPHEVGDCVQDMKYCNCGGIHLDGFKGCVVYQKSQVVLRIKMVDHLSYAQVVKKVSLAKGAVVSSEDDVPGSQGQG